MQEKLFQMLTNEDEITWQSILHDLIKSEQMDPWDIDISVLANKYIETIKEIEEHNFFISGKIVLAASILLKFKSQKLVDKDLVDFDELLYHNDDEDILSDDVEDSSEFEKEIPPLLIKTPQARKRKVNLNDLMEALQSALEVDNRRFIKRRDEKEIRSLQANIIKKVDVSKLIKDLYNRIKEFFKKHPKVTFTELVPTKQKIDKVYTFIPLLHLEHKGKINLHQEKTFGEIEITEQKE